MNFVEAIKSGKEFKRSLWKDDHWLHVWRGYKIFYVINEAQWYWKLEDFMANDWQLRDVKYGDD